MQLLLSIKKEIFSYDALKKSDNNLVKIKLDKNNLN